MKLPGALGHLTYCTNVHPGETWPAVDAVLRSDVLAVRDAMDAGGPFAIGLRLSARALADAARPEALAAMKAHLAAERLYVFTLNAFPYGPFHGTPVKADVYLPDWRAEERLAYTNAAADYLAALLPPGMEGSVSTAPGAFRANVGSSQTLEAIADAMLRHAAHLVAIERRTGAVIALAIEPEPACLLETTAEAVAFFEAHLFSPAAVARLAALTGLSPGDAEAALRRHLGLCFDLCHAAVEFEDAGEAVALLRSAGVKVAKMQVSSGLRLPEVGRDAATLLGPFDDEVYLHQVVERTGDGLLNRYDDLRDAFAALATAGPDAGREWRVHYHVPLFLEALGAFASTQPFVREALELHRRQPISQHLEVETYTWGVLPDAWRAASLPEAIARELTWVRDQWH
ncbi:metabolite traffic protein EboE [Sphingomonas quercus]|uniref:Metabolite traffic protein EboE n=1 Tax=Sphingomonas quercus TaxID=2842451 RepID=A0ABS6BKZ9_9SPHN|nr:metabolite traffic protein EboE [Sphingomonas quercus]MBU3078983.1 metabolite traffic protein EboE [Sphingomonas quercus]